jgi:hypothetical protein
MSCGSEHMYAANVVTTATVSAACYVYVLCVSLHCFLNGVLACVMLETA